MGQQRERACTEKVQTEFEEREARLRDELIAERDQQLEILMEKLSREHVEQQRKLKEDSAALVEAARVSSTQKLQALSSQLADFQKRCTALETQHEHLEGEKLELQERVNSGQQREERLESRIQCLESETEERHQNSERVLATQREELWKVEERKKKEIDDVREEAAKLRIT